MDDRRFDNFDEFAKGYHNNIDELIKLSGTDSNFFSQYRIEELKLYEDTSESLSLLDFGCGTGNGSFYIRKHFPEITIQGIDISEESIGVANGLNLGNAEFNTFDGIHLPYEDEALDIVFAAMVFHHIEHSLHESVLNEIRRVLKKGGRFYMFEHNPYNPFTLKVVKGCKYDKDAALLSPAYGKRIMKEAGFRKSQVRYTIFVPRIKWLIWATGIEKYIKWMPIGAQYYTRCVK